MDNLEPITRNEMFLNGDDLEPITREEMILAGEDLEPITRHEWFLKKYRGGGGGGGYDLVNVPNLPADIASFNDGTDLPMASLKVAVTPYQDLSHGDPSPSNICPIIGWDEAVVTVADDAESPTTSHEYTIDLDGTRYGGVLDATNGTMTVDRAEVDLGTLNWIKGNMNTAGTGRIFYIQLTASSPMKQPSDIGLCEALKYNPFSNWSAGQWEKQILNGITVTGSSALVACVPDIYSTASDFKTSMQGVQLVYELATPITVQLAPTAVKSIEGENNISANCGQITEVKYFKRA